VTHGKSRARGGHKTFLGRGAGLGVSGAGQQWLVRTGAGTGAPIPRGGPLAPARAIAAGAHSPRSPSHGLNSDAPPAPRMRVRPERLATDPRAGALCVFATGSPVRVHSLDGLDARLARAAKRAAEAGAAKAGEAAVVDTMGLARASLLVVAGLGRRDRADGEALRHAAGAAARAAEGAHARDVAIAVPRGLIADEAEAAACAAEGARLALYEFGRRASPAPRHVSSIRVLHGTARAAAAVRRAAAITEAVILARDAANMPPNECTPAALAAIARRAGPKVRCRVISGAELRRRGFGGILAVGGASHNAPRLIIMEHRGAPRTRRPVLLVGKAVTFDTGGISIKPGERMEEMKFDKCGGCAVIGAMRAASLLGIKDNIVGIVPAVENMPGGGAYRPGDIVRLYSKKTAEIINTDAEGRLILADALSYGEQAHRPRAIIDLATLTGACIVALGASTAGLVSTSDALARSIERAAARTGERVWRLPIDDDYASMIDSKVADMRNMGIGRTAGTIAAAAFLRRAVGDTPWAHLDIAGPAWTQVGTVRRSYNAGGATGFGVRLLAEYLSPQ